MSIKVMTWVWDNSDAAGSELLLLLAMADFADDEGICWPSIDVLADKTRTSRSTVKRYLASLEARGLLRVEINEGGTSRTHPNRRPNRYKLMTHLGGQIEPPNPQVGVQKPSSGGPTVNHKPSLEPSVKHLFENDFDEAWSFYPRKHGRKAALAAYVARRRAGAPAHDLLEASKLYAKRMSGKEQTWIKHGSTFFGPNDHWREELDPATKPEGTWNPYTLTWDR